MKTHPHLYSLLPNMHIFIFIFFFFFFFAITTPTLSQSQAQINSNSVLIALLDSHYTDLAELLDKALLLPSLETTVGVHNITIFAPRNDALSNELKLFLLQPRNLPSLQTLVLSHIVPSRIGSASGHRHKTLSGETISLRRGQIVSPDAITRPDGVIHVIDSVLIPRSVEDEFNRRRSLRSTSAVKPQGAPEVDPRTHRLKTAAPVAAGAPPVLPIFDALAPGPDLAPAPAPGPGGPHHHFDGARQVKDFIRTLVEYGGYNELADILVNLTSLASEMGRLVSEGYVLTVLAPNDEAMSKVTAERLAEPGAPEQMVYYHLIPEYQTEESMYNAVRRFGKVRYDTLRLPHKVVAREADGSVQFGDGESVSAYLFDPDIYVDGRISVQGIDEVLFPLEEDESVPKKAQPAKVVAKPKRGKLLEVACWMLGTLRQDSQFPTCY